MARTPIGDGKGGIMYIDDGLPEKPPAPKTFEATSFNAGRIAFPANREMAAALAGTLDRLADLPRFLRANGHDALAGVVDEVFEVNRDALREALVLLDAYRVGGVSEKQNHRTTDEMRRVLRKAGAL